MRARWQGHGRRRRLLSALPTRGVGQRVLLELHELHTVHVRHEDLGDPQAPLGLVVLRNTAQAPLCGAQCPIQQVHVALLRLAAPLLLPRCPAADFQGAGLEIRCVGAGHQLPIPVIPWKPGLEVILHRGRVIQSSGHDVNHPVGQLQGLVEFLRQFDHILVDGRGLLGGCQYELLHLLELVNSKEPPDIRPMGPRLSPEAGGNPSVPQRELRGLQPLPAVVGSKGLLGSGD
mmetsp:Transcript_2984/g.5868  ORF Transcript_2984/g.5868 Transcript_2984/m.5868 type:complete len:232 (+) Transcript_2984:309-1004(+)